MTERINYLEELLPKTEGELEHKYLENFEKNASYVGNGVYSWFGILANDTRELWLMGVLSKEKVEYEEE